MIPTNQIETGYKIGGRTWISVLWNAGKLTRQEVQEAIAEYASDRDKTEDDIRAELLESEAELAREQCEEEGNTTPYEEVLKGRVERELENALAEQADKCAVAEALEELYDCWKDDVEDEDQFDLVYQAHAALDIYCRKLTHGDYCL